MLSVRYMEDDFNPVKEAGDSFLREVFAPRPSKILGLLACGESAFSGGDDEAGMAKLRALARRSLGPQLAALGISLPPAAAVGAESEGDVS